MNTPEIKAGQRWKAKNPDRYSYILTVLFVDHESVLTENECGIRCLDPVISFNEYNQLLPEPQTRPITADDIMKMLAANPVLWYSELEEDSWDLVESSLLRRSDVCGFKYSHNPFAANAEIVGPEIEVKE